MSSSEDAAATTDVILRFVGDPVGYRATIQSPTPTLDKPYWTTATVGTTRQVAVDVAKAYLIEPATT